MSLYSQSLIWCVHTVRLCLESCMMLCNYDCGSMCGNQKGKQNGRTKNHAYECMAKFFNCDAHYCSCTHYRTQICGTYDYQSVEKRSQPGYLIVRAYYLTVHQQHGHRWSLICTILLSHWQSLIFTTFVLESNGTVPSILPKKRWGSYLPATPFLLPVEILY